jgi:NAD(P)-dependent dehydrogenase (short-subunit alcohol dehydrogenase family)
MGYDFDDTTAIVTGAASGIGQKAARRLAAEGASVVAADLDVDQGTDTVDDIESAGGTATFVETDVSDPEDVQAMVETAVDEYGGLDVAVNNAGIEGDNDPLVEQTEDNWEQVIDVNLKGVWLCMKHELAEMTDGGAIVNVSSIAGLTAAGGTPYVASKHGVIGLTRVGATEAAPENVRVNAVCPGVIDTAMVDRAREETPEEIEQFVQMQPLGRMGEPDEVADAIVWLASDEASFVTGNAYPVDGGYMAL